MNNELVILPVEVKELVLKVSEQKQNEVNTVLNQIFTGTSNWESQVDAIEVKDINDKLSIQMADAARKNIKQARLSAEKIFDAKRDEVQQLKSEFDLEDKLWLKAKQVMQIKFKAIEEKAEWKASFVQRFEAEQKELRTQLRIEKVSKFNPELNRVEFENMNDEMFNIFLSSIEKAYNDKIEAEQKAEKERIEKERVLKLYNERKESILNLWSFASDIEKALNFGEQSEQDFKDLVLKLNNAKIEHDKKQDAIWLENERLKKEQEEKEKRNKKRNDELRPYVIFIRDYNKMLSMSEEEYIKELSDIKIGAEQHWEFERKERQKQIELQREKDKQIEKERKEKEALQAGIQAQKDAKEKELIEKEKAEKLAQLAPDKEKLTAWVKSFTINSAPIVSENLTPTEKLIEEKFNSFKSWAMSQIEGI